MKYGAQYWTERHIYLGLYRVSQKKVSDKIFLGYYLLVLTTGQLTSMPARRRGLEPCSHDRPQLVHLCFCLSSWHCLWNSQSWYPRLLARQIWGDHPSRRPALHCQACSSQFKHRWRRFKRDSTLTIMSINADCLHVCMSVWDCLPESHYFHWTMTAKRKRKKRQEIKNTIGDGGSTAL